MGPARLILYLTPLVMLLTGIAPVADMSIGYFTIVGCYLIAVWTAVKMASNGCGQLIGIEMAMMASFPSAIAGAVAGPIPPASAEVRRYGQTPHDRRQTVGPAAHVAAGGAGGGFHCCRQLGRLARRLRTLRRLFRPW